MALHCEISNLLTESDVEQKFIYPFLTQASPLGLGLDDSEIFTKQILRQRLIGKGQTQKYYYPDYLIMIRGIPILVIEAKKPDEPLASGYSEARLYAQEVNASFPHKVNACQYIMACNGKELWVGYADQAEPEILLTYDDFNIENKKFHELAEFLSKEKLSLLANKPYVDARGNAHFDTPVSHLGGKRVQNEELVENSFGRTLVFENRKIFDPETEEDRTVVVKNAYITSAKRDQHAEPMYKEIRKFELPSRSNSTAIATEEPNEFVGKLSERIIQKNDAYSLMLLIGNVGSGKTTFTRYFRHIFLANYHPDLYSKCEWVFINMNFAPVTSSEVYSWLKQEIIQGIIAEHPDIDFEKYETILKVFRRETSRFSKGIGSILCDDKAAYNKELYNLLLAAQQNPDTYLDALIFFVKENFSHIPIVVLDNCDKRNKSEQLLMFEVAQWLRRQYQCIVILPMRDVTYDTYRNEPPLDTVVKDLVFRIDPPDLLKVLQARLDFITRTTDQAGYTYVLRNGMQVAVKRSELIDYFRLLMVAIRKDRWISNIFYRLADRNIRNGIQIFEDFCKSGHMDENDIFSVRILGDDADIPTHKFMNVLLRKNRRYYNGEESNFINLFGSDFHDDLPDPFARIDILRWLIDKINIEGPSGNRGLFPISSLGKELQLLGHKKEVIFREAVYLVKKGLVFCETSSDPIEEGDLIKMAIPGSLHHNMIGNVAYIAACAEDTLFKSPQIMTRISRRLREKDYLSKLSIALNARDLIQYLESYRQEFTAEVSSLLSDGKLMSAFDLARCRSSIKSWIESDTRVSEAVRYIDRYTFQSIISATIVSKNSGGVVCKIGSDGAKGFLSTLDIQYGLDYSTYSKITVGDILSCEIFAYDNDHGSFQLKYLGMADQPPAI